MAACFFVPGNGKPRPAKVRGPGGARAPQEGKEGALRGPGKSQKQPAPCKPPGPFPMPRIRGGHGPGDACGGYFTASVPAARNTMLAPLASGFPVFLALHLDFPDRSGIVAAMVSENAPVPFAPANFPVPPIAL